MENRVKEMLRVNEQQRTYYERASGAEESPVNSTATNLWRRLRKRMFAPLKDAGVQDDVNALHRQWLGDISASRVLDLGVGAGNPLSIELARDAREYVAIDLSHTRIEAFRKKLETAGIYNARLYTADFLSDDFRETGFNVVYAMSILHHFRYMDSFLSVLHDRMAINGVVITLDPLQTWMPAHIVRMCYRPFQTDASWEYPFTHSSIETIQRYFDVERVQGLYGRSKWAMGLALLHPKLATHKALSWQNRDLKEATNVDKITSCLQATFMLRKR